MKSKPPRTVAELEEILRPTCPWDLARYLQSVAIDATIAEAMKPLDASLQSASFAFDAEPGTVAADLAQRCNSDAGRHLAGLLAGKFVLDQCKELPGIREKLAPVFDELAAARAAEAEAARQTSLERQQVRDDLAARRAATLAELDRAEAEALAAV